MRHCNNCGKTKPVSEFYPSYKTQCRACLQSKAVSKRDEKIAYLKKWRQEHPEAHREWRTKNREARSAYMERWHSENRAKRAESYANWSRANRPRVYALISKRRAAKHRAVAAWANHAAIAAMYDRAARITKQTGVRHEVDHVYPLQSDWVCGLHCEANLQILTKSENVKKSNRRVPVAA